jgi:hypothetical protein
MSVFHTPGGCFSFYYDAGRSWLESVQSFRCETVPKLLTAGFREVKDCDGPVGAAK